MTISLYISPINLLSIAFFLSSRLLWNSTIWSSLSSYHNIQIFLRYFLSIILSDVKIFLSWWLAYKPFQRKSCISFPYPYVTWKKLPVGNMADLCQHLIRSVFESWSKSRVINNFWKGSACEQTVISTSLNWLVYV